MKDNDEKNDAVLASSDQEKTNLEKQYLENQMQLVSKHTTDIKGLHEEAESKLLQADEKCKVLQE